MHAVRHRITPDDVGRIVAALDAAGVDAIEVAHGDGLAGGIAQLRPRRAHRLGVDRGRRREHRAAPRSPRCCCPASAPSTTSSTPTTSASARCASPPTAPRPTSSAQHIATARELGMDVSGFLMMSHMAAPDELAQQAKLMESYGAHCVYVTDSGGRLTMDGVARAGPRLPRRPRRRTPRSASTPTRTSRCRWPTRVVAVEEGVTRVDASLAGHGAGAGNCPIEAFIAVADLHGLEARLRPVRAAGRRRRPRPPAAGPAGPGRPRDPHPRLRRRLLQLPAARRDAPPQRYGVDVRDDPARRSAGAARRRPGGHDRRHRPRPAAGPGRGRATRSCHPRS